jgi:Holliday junction resolvasome RuvABC endonuclease subunit
MSAILGLDCSTLNLGWCVLDVKTARPIASGETPLIGADLDERIAAAASLAAFRLARRSDWALLAFEEPFVAHFNRKTGIKLAQITGALVYVASEARVRVLRIAPTQGKLALTGSGAARKVAMIEACRVQFGLSAGEHQADAIGVALAAAVNLKETQLCAVK